MKMKKSKKYFTVLEMLTAMSLLSVIMYALLSMLDQSQSAMNKGMSRLSVTDEARSVLDQIENDITCVAYQDALEKDSHNVSSMQDHVLKTTANGFQVYTSRPGRLPLLCKVSYEKAGNNLVVKTSTFDEGDGSWKAPANEPAGGRILLTNVLAFEVRMDRYSGLGADKDGNANNFPMKVTVDLQLIDDETRKLGYTSINDSKTKPINRNEIEKKLGDKSAFNARAARFSRVVTLAPPES